MIIKKVELFKKLASFYIYKCYYNVFLKYKIVKKFNLKFDDLILLKNSELLVFKEVSIDK